MVHVFTQHVEKKVSKWFSKVKKYFTINLPDYIEEATALVALLRAGTHNRIFESELTSYQWQLLEDINHFPIVRYNRGKWERLYAKLPHKDNHLVGEVDTQGGGVAAIVAKPIQEAYIVHLVGQRFWDSLSIYPPEICAVVLNAMFFREELHRLKSKHVDITNPDDVLELVIENAEFLAQTLLNAQCGEDKIGRTINHSHFSVHSAYPYSDNWSHETKQTDGLLGALIKLQQLHLAKEPVIYVSER